MSTIKSIFGKYASELQVFVDTNIDAFKEPFFPKYFDMGTPQMSLNYLSIIGKSRLEAAASVVAHGSEAPLRSRAGLEKLSGEVSSIKVKRRMDEEQYRNWMTIEAMSTSDEAKKRQIMNLIWDDVSYVSNSVLSRIDIMAGQALSQGVIKINSTTNPDGVVPGEIDLLVDKKKDGYESGDTSASFGWSNSDDNFWSIASAASNAPIADIESLKDNAWENHGITLETILMTPNKWRAVRKSTEVKGYFDSKEPTLDEMNSLLSSLDCPTIEIVRIKPKIETNGTLSSIDAWEDDKYVTFLPAGSAGIIHNSLSVEQISPVPNVDYATLNNILISKWSQTEPFGEYTRGEIAAFPGLEVADQMYIINTESRTGF